MWLKGLSYIPKKLRDLYEVNKILAHRPWLLNPQHLQVSSSAVRWKFLEAIPQNTFHARSTPRFPKFGKRKEDFDIKTQFLTNKLNYYQQREWKFYEELGPGIQSSRLFQRKYPLLCNWGPQARIPAGTGFSSNKYPLLVGTYIPNILR